MVYGVVIGGVPMVTVNGQWLTLEEYATLLGHRKPVVMA